MLFINMQKLMVKIKDYDNYDKMKDYVKNKE